VTLGTLTGTNPAAVAHFAALHTAYAAAVAAAQQARANGNAAPLESEPLRIKRKPFAPPVVAGVVDESSLNGAVAATANNSRNSLRTKRRRPTIETSTADDNANAAADPQPPPPPSQSTTTLPPRKRGRPSTLELAQRMLALQAAEATPSVPSPPPGPPPPSVLRRPPPPPTPPPPPPPRARKLAPQPDKYIFVDTTVPDDEEMNDDTDESEQPDSPLIVSRDLFEFDGSVQQADVVLSAATVIEHDKDDDDDDDDDDDNDDNAARASKKRRSVFEDAGATAADMMMLSPFRMRRQFQLARSPGKRSPAHAAAAASANGGLPHELDELELLFNTGPSLSKLRSHSTSARVRALSPVSSPSLLSPSAVKLSVPHARNVSKNVVRCLMSPNKHDTPLARAVATESEAAARGHAPHNGNATPRRLLSGSVPSTPRRVTIVSNAPPSAPSPRRTTMLSHNKAYLTRLTMAGGSSLAERFGVDLSPMSPTRSSPRRPTGGVRVRELLMRTPTAGGSLVIGGSLGQEVLVRPRNLSASFHAPQNLFSESAK
jgi:hypothetical protein